MNDPPPAVRCYQAPVLFCASAVARLGTAIIDQPRLRLLLIPFSFLVSAYGAGTLLSRKTGQRSSNQAAPAPSNQPMSHPPSTSVA